MLSKLKPNVEPCLNYSKSSIRSKLKLTRQIFHESNIELLTPEFYLSNYLPKLLPLLPADKLISLYLPINHELDSTPFLDYFLLKNYSLSLPIVVQKSQPLLFRRYADSTQLKKGHFNVLEPVDTEVVVPDVIILPLVGFSPKCHRIGYGGGYYDRTIELIKKEKSVRLIGLAFECQKIRKEDLGP
jgi:5,10-methenyltetrahydrofolate synthetase